MNDTADLKSRLRLETLVEGAGHLLKREGKNLVCCCPFHDEKTGSFKINTEEQFFKCFSCNAGGDVLNWIAWTLFKKFEVDGADFGKVIDEARKHAGLPEERPAKSAKPATVYPTIAKLKEAAQYAASGKGGKVAAVYEYGSPPDLIVFRVEDATGKSFMQAHPVEGGYSFGGLKVNPIYNRTRVAKTPVVVLVEGEKCVHRLAELGIVATTSPGGSNGSAKADWSPLAGKKVIFWRDNDDSGLTYQEAVVKALTVLGAKMSIVDVSTLGLDKGGDVVDFCAKFTETGECDNAVRAVLSGARGMGKIAALAAEFEDSKAGRRYAVPFPWDTLSKATAALMPGSLVVLAGSPGASKSLALNQCLLSWHREHKCAILELEDGVTYHMRRATAQLAGCSGLTSDAWCHEHPAEVDVFQASYADELESFSDCLYDLGDMNPTGKVVLSWLADRLANGCRIVAIDPFTLIDFGGKESWNEQQSFMFEAGRMIEKAKASLILVTHPRKMQSGHKGGVALDDMAGGAVVTRKAHCVLWLETHAKKLMTVTINHEAPAPSERVEVEYNRTFNVLKARNSWGGGRGFAFMFQRESLTMKEIGGL